MKGKIKSYNKEKGYGFIIGSDEKTYFLHISNVININEIFVGDICEFEPTYNEKGLLAKSVIIINYRKMTFLNIDGYRIKLSDIESYGIGHITKKEYIYENLENEAPITKAAQEFIKKSSLFYRIADSIINYPKEEEVIVSSYLYVYVQKDDGLEYIKFEKPIEELKEIERQLDEYFGVINNC
ncbi:cold-shock protein [Clostridium perfringens]|uniref:cold-shock protein n=1 Tax=Clostridium perfringens TaxID=1502 RepID=UPI000DF0F2F4|nr:cold shock domain-containing protein [Clostridium perfringens]STB67863.1 'Cold-shock' DNA-binding domain [Clostridium perfringens]